MDKNISILLASFINKVKQNSRQHGFEANSNAEKLIVDIVMTSLNEQIAEIMAVSGKAK